MMSSSSTLLDASTADRAPLLLISTWVWTAFAIVFVALRFFCRMRLIRSTWWDDWLILAAVVWIFHIFRSVGVLSSQL